MRRSLVFVVGFVLCNIASAATDVCSLTVDGLVNNQTWTQDGSPYKVTCDIFVAGLEIEPGVEVLVDGDFRIEVLSSITAVGTAAEPILFSASDPAVPWKGLRFRSTPAGSSFAHCIIEKAASSGVWRISPHK